MTSAARETLNDLTDGIIHAFGGGWMTLSEIIAAWDAQYRQDMDGKPFLVAPHEVAEWLAILAAEGAVHVRATTPDGKRIDAIDGTVDATGGE